MKSGSKLDISLFLDHICCEEFEMFRTEIPRRREHIIFQYFHVGRNIVLSDISRAILREARLQLKLKHSTILFIYTSS